MQNSVFQYLDNLGFPLSESYLVGTKEQADAFTKLMHGSDDLVKCEEVKGSIDPSRDKIVLNDLTFICEKNGNEEPLYECSYNNHHFISGHQDSVNGRMIVHADEATEQYELDIKLFCLFPSFELYAVCENCDNTGSYEGAEMPDSKIVSCECPNVIFQYE